ncbi:hypothetical protein Q2T91_16500 [Ralstonia pseudosolanacearum]|uniref:hypothetical protein n=1 Tax=Ralstonia pseudosolanacearum TaxID=1310165 RepID=UPI001FF9BB60|nr:hypothetical protein [Ralstonia pseudosolanacearum]
MLVRIADDMGMTVSSFTRQLFLLACRFERFVIDVLQNAGLGFTFELDAEGNIESLREHGLGMHYSLFSQWSRLRLHPSFQHEWECVFGKLQFAPATTFLLAVLERCGAGIRPLYNWPDHPAVRVTWHPWKRRSDAEVALSGQVLEFGVAAAVTSRRTGPVFMGQIFNDLLDEIRAEAKRTRLKRYLDDRADAADRAVTRMQSFVSELFTRAARLRVLRVTLGYQKEDAATIADERAKSDWECFAKQSRSQAAASGILGLIWRREWGVERGIYVDCLLFIPAALSSSAYHVAGRMTEQWRLATSQAGDTRIADLGVYARASHACADMMMERELIRLVTYLGEKDRYLRAKDHWANHAYGIWKLQGKKVSLGKTALLNPDNS